nr:MAG TPA: hypothetical protein [Caudoviricetes sp.]
MCINRMIQCGGWTDGTRAILFLTYKAPQDVGEVRKSVTLD